MSKKRIQVLVEPELYDQLEKQSNGIGLSLSSFVRLKLMERPLLVENNILTVPTVNIDTDKLIYNLERGRRK